jgi:hypothetical protein
MASARLALVLLACGLQLLSCAGAPTVADTADFKAKFSIIGDAGSSGERPSRRGDSLARRRKLA